MAGVNLGNAGGEAIREMRGSPEFRQFVEALGEKAWDLIRSSLESDTHNRVHQTSWAKGVYDVWVAITAELHGVRQEQRASKAPVAIEKMRQ